MTKLIILLISMWCVTNGMAQTPTYANVDYVGDGNPKHLLDVYIPEGVTKPAKTVVYIHGGAWAKGSKESAFGHCSELYNAKYVIVSINYRLSQDSIFPAQIYDCKTAIRFIKTHAADYLIDTCNIGVTGTSAGGHLVALLGTSNGVKNLEGHHLGSTKVSSNVHAVADFYGPTNFLEMDGYIPISCEDPQIHNAPNSRESNLLGCWIKECPEKVAMANPITYIDGNEPSFSIYHGDADCTVACHQSVLLQTALIDKGQDSELTLYPGAGHGGFIDAKVKAKMLLFFNRVLVNKPNN